MNRSKRDINNNRDKPKNCQDTLNELFGNNNSEDGTYKVKSGTTGSLDGHNYEINLSIIAKLRGDKDKYHEYKLATNVAGRRVFDDVAMSFQKNKFDEITAILLQAKHVDDSKRGKITVDKFLSPRNDKFYLGKYFLDLLDYKKKQEQEKSHHDPLQCVKYVIYTNAILDERFDESRIIGVSDIIFSTKLRQSRAFKFCVGDENLDIIEALEKISYKERIKPLAEALIPLLTGEVSYKQMMADKFISTYHVFLAKYVIDVGEKILVDKKKNEYREGRINFKFSNAHDDSSHNKEFIEEVLYEYTKSVVFNGKPSSGLDKSNRAILVNKMLNSSNYSGEVLDEKKIEIFLGNIVFDTNSRRIMFVNEDKIKDEESKQFIRDLKNKLCDLDKFRLDIPHELVKRTMIKQTEKVALKLHVNFGNINPRFKKKESDKLIVKLGEKVVDSGKPKIIIDDKEFSKGEIKILRKLVGNLLLLDQKTNMLRLASENGLTGDPKRLLDLIKNKLKLRGIDSNNCRFEVKVKNFPRESLMTDNDDRAIVEEFLSNLEIFTGQANVHELQRTIIDEMRDHFKLTQEEVQDCFLRVKDKAEEYWRGPVYLQRDDDFFKNIVRRGITFDVKEPLDLFHGRKTELIDLHDKLQNNQNSIQTTVTSKICCISGLGGIGKTELARKYAYVYGKNYDNNVIWINAESYSTLVASFLRLAQDKLEIQVKRKDGDQKDITSIVEDVYKFFSKRKSLFIFNNAEKLKSHGDDNGGIDKFLPSLPLEDNKPCILITSRNQSWGSKIVVMKLDTFTKTEAMEFIRIALNINDDSQYNEIIELAEKLQCFPLALHQAAAYIGKTDAARKNFGSKFQIRDYLQRFENETKKLLNFKFPEDCTNLYTKTTFTTWINTIDKIKKNKKYGSLAVQILNTIAYTLPDDIFPEVFLGLEPDEEKLGKAVQLLKQYSMINSDDEEISFKVHTLVQLATRLKLKKNVEKAVLRKAMKLYPYNDAISNNPFSPNVNHAYSIRLFATEHSDLVKESLELQSIAKWEGQKGTNPLFSLLVDR